MRLEKIPVVPVWKSCIRLLPGKRTIVSKVYKDPKDSCSAQEVHMHHKATRRRRQQYFLVTILFRLWWLLCDTIILNFNFLVKNYYNILILIHNDINLPKRIILWIKRKLSMKKVLIRKTLLSHLFHQNYWRSHN